MCGITGFYQYHKLDHSHLKRMTDAIRHRGPDDEGFYLDRSSGTGLGHRRLSILDLSILGHQPMTYRNSGLWIVYNGEIYNFIELRSELRKKGYTFKTETDTEVILASYLEWKEEAFSKFNGMWAFAIYDDRAKDLLLCRDRYGIKPLYYSSHDGATVFGSETKVFWAIKNEFQTSWDERGLRTALFSPFQLESSGSTLVDSVKNLLPGHYLKADQFGVTVHQWWKTMDHLVSVPCTLDEQGDYFRELFMDSCRLRMRSDVPIGTSLSGGLDSSSIVVMLNHISRTHSIAERAPQSWQRTFVHSFPGTPLDETVYAEIAADAGSTKKIIVSATSDNIISNLDRILYHFESVYEGMTDSVWRIYEAQRKNGVIVSLDGHGADEMLAGYDWYLSGALEGTSLLSGRFWRLLNQQQEMLGARLSPRIAIPTILRSRRWVRSAFQQVKKYLPVLRRNDEFLSRYAADIQPYPEVSSMLPDNIEPLNAMLYQDFHHRILPRILKNFDTMSMSHGVEVRMPFMDYRLVNYVFSLPAGSKIGEGFNKLILRRAMKGLLPDDIRLRKTKIGFNSPLQQWLPGEMRPWVEATLDLQSPAEALISRSKLKDYYAKNICSGKARWSEALRFWKYLNIIKLTNVMTNAGNQR